MTKQMGFLMRSSIFITCILVCVLARHAGAQTRLVFPEDPAGDEIRATAASFWNAVADGDKAKALSFCSDTVESPAFLDSSISNLKASEELRTALISRFGDSK